MRANAGAYRLTFSLPKSLWASAIPGYHQPCLEGCQVAIMRGYVVFVEGPSKELVFDQARRILRIICKGHIAVELPARLESPLRDRFGRPYPGRDTWSIIVNAEIAFTPTSLSSNIMETPRAG